jgi:DNA-binding response OmpR family regulator
MKTWRILIADDDQAIRKFIRVNLEARDFEILTAVDGDEALKMIEKEMPDLIILDIMMPKMDGFTVCQQVREWSRIPIIMLSARDSEQDKVRCLDCGADDYLTKPFSLQELLSRIKAVLRRSEGTKDKLLQSNFRLNDLEVDLNNNKVLLGGQDIRLTGTEHKLLVYLTVNAGRVITSDQLLEKVWGEDFIGEDRLLQVNICRLRRKLKESARNSKYILTRPGIGYYVPKPDATLRVNDPHPI